MKLQSGLSAVITGGASGLGEACARRLAEAGVKVTLFDLNDEKGEALASEIGGLYVKTDVSDPEAVKAGRVEIRDATCPAVYTGLQAAEKGIPFMPIRGIIGSDILANRPDWKVIDNPFREPGETPGDPIVLIPAIRPDFAVVHVSEADRFGNAWIGGRHELKTMAHAARCTLVTAERIVEGDLREDEAKSANLITPIYVEALAEAPGGAWPLACPPDYALDAGAVRAYASAARQSARSGGGDDWLRVLTPGHAEAAE